MPARNDIAFLWFVFPLILLVGGGDAMIKSFSILTLSTVSFISYVVANATINSINTTQWRALSVPLQVPGVNVYAATVFHILFVSLLTISNITDYSRTYQRVFSNRITQKLWSVLGDDRVYVKLLEFLWLSVAEGFYGNFEIRLNVLYLVTLVSTGYILTTAVCILLMLFLTVQNIFSNLIIPLVYRAGSILSLWRHMNRFLPHIPRHIHVYGIHIDLEILIANFIGYSYCILIILVTANLYNILEWAVVVLVLVLVLLLYYTGLLTVVQHTFGAPVRYILSNLIRLLVNTAGNIILNGCQSILTWFGIHIDVPTLVPPVGTFLGCIFLVFILFIPGILYNILVWVLGVLDVCSAELFHYMGLFDVTQRMLYAVLDALVTISNYVDILSVPVIISLWLIIIILFSILAFVVWSDHIVPSLNNAGNRISVWFQRFMTYMPGYIYNPQSAYNVNALATVAHLLTCLIIILLLSWITPGNQLVSVLLLCYSGLVNIVHRTFGVVIDILVFILESFRQWLLTLIAIAIAMFLCGIPLEPTPPNGGGVGV
jgi:hypothetical protein